MRKEVDISEEELHRLYLEEELSVREMAERYGCSEPQITAHLRQCGIKPRSALKGYDITEEELRRLYLEEELPVREIAEICGCLEPQITGHLRRCGIEPRSALKGYDVSEDELRRLYLEEELPVREIAEICGCLEPQITGHLRQCGIEPRSAPRSYDISEEELGRLYLGEGLSVAAIAQEKGVASPLIARRLRQYAIAPRPVGSTVGGEIDQSKARRARKLAEARRARRLGRADPSAPVPRLAQARDERRSHESLPKPGVMMGKEADQSKGRRGHRSSVLAALSAPASLEDRVSAHVATFPGVRLADVQAIFGLSRSQVEKTLQGLVKAQRIHNKEDELFYPV